LIFSLLESASALAAQPAGPDPRNAPMPAPRDVKLADERRRDPCAWVDAATQTHYLVGGGRRGPHGWRT
jgi:hypothetical protein